MSVTASSVALPKSIGTVVNEVGVRCPAEGSARLPAVEAGRSNLNYSGWDCFPEIRNKG
jgi:hypothetical protein